MLLGDRGTRVGPTSLKLLHQQCPSGSRTYDFSITGAMFSLQHHCFTPSRAYSITNQNVKTFYKIATPLSTWLHGWPVKDNMVNYGQVAGCINVQLCMEVGGLWSSDNCSDHIKHATMYTSSDRITLKWLRLAKRERGCVVNPLQPSVITWLHNVQRHKGPTYYF